jgi:predicted nucleic acid-binding protein
LSLVLDSSATLAWCFEDERTEPLRQLLDQVVENGAVVPSLWRFEVANGLQMAVRRKRIDEGFRDRILGNLATLEISVDAESDVQVWSTTTRLAALYGLTIYDASYLELAQRRRLPLATQDAALEQAARQAAVPLSL